MGISSRFPFSFLIHVSDTLFCGYIYINHLGTSLGMRWKEMKVRLITKGIKDIGFSRFGYVQKDETKGDGKKKFCIFRRQVRPDDKWNQDIDQTMQKSFGRKGLEN